MKSCRAGLLNDSDLGTTQSSSCKCCALLKKKDSTGTFHRCPNKQKYGGDGFCGNHQKRGPRSGSVQDARITWGARQIKGKGKGKARVERRRKGSGESSDEEVVPVANYESDGKLVGEAIRRSTTFRLIWPL